MLAMSGALIFAACGSDSDDVSGGSAEELPSDATDAPADSSDSGASTETTAADSSDDSVDSGGTSGAAVDGDFCAAVADVMDKASAVDDVGSDLSGFGDAFAQLGEVGGMLDEIRDDAPEEIKGDLETLAEAFHAFEDELPRIQEMADALQEAGNDPAKLQEVLAEFSDVMEGIDTSSLDTTEVQEAGENVSRYVQDNCGIDVGS